MHELRLEVKSQYACYLGLVERPPSFVIIDRMYEIVFDSEDGNQITRGQLGMISLGNYQGHLVSSDTFTPFWVTWNNGGHVTIGQGFKVGQHIIMSGQDPRSTPFKTNHIYVSNLKGSANWRFHIPEAMRPLGK